MFGFSLSDNKVRLNLKNLSATHYDKKSFNIFGRDHYIHGVTQRGCKRYKQHMSRQIELKTNAQLAKMNQAGLVLHERLDAVVAAAKPGVTTHQVPQGCRAGRDKRGATSHFVGDYG